MKEGGKIGIILVFLWSAAFIRLMNNTMKDLVEKNMPVINRSIQQHLFLMLFTASMYDDMSYNIATCSLQ